MCRHFNVFEHENTPSKILKHSMSLYIRPTLKILMFPHTRPCFTGMGRSVVNLFFNLRSQIGCPLSLIVNSKTCLKRPLKKKTLLNTGQKYCRMLPGSILQYFRPAFSAHLSLRPLSIFFSGRFRQILLFSPTIGKQIKYTNAKITLFIGRFSRVSMKFKNNILD